MKIRSHLLNQLAAAAFAAAVWLLFRTLKLDFRLEDPDTNPYSLDTSQRYLYCVWHDSMVIPTFAGKQHSSAALISQHTDGSFVARVLRLVGMATIRGSTNHITPGAIRKLLEAMQSQHLVITPDGPRGPNRKMSLGIVYIASRASRAVIPTAYCCSRAWRIKGSWSDLIIPKPFATVFLLGGRPIEVPAKLRSAELEQYAARIQAEMDRLNAAAEQLAAGPHRAASDVVTGRPGPVQKTANPCALPPRGG